MMRVWVLVFLFKGDPAASGPHELETCLMMAQTQIERGIKAHCWNRVTRERKSPTRQDIERWNREWKP